MNNENRPKVSVITLNYNQCQYTLDCIISLLESNYSNLNILLIDNGSIKEKYEDLLNRLPKDIRIKVLRIEKNIGYVGGINYGLNYISGIGTDYVLIMNNDTIIASKSIASLVDVAERSGRQAIVSGKVYHYDQRRCLQYIGQYKDPTGGIRHKSAIQSQGVMDVGQFDMEIEMGMLDDIYWLFPFKLVEEIGGYSEYFYLYVEQNDFALRAIKHGYKLIYTPKAALWHKGGVTTCDMQIESPRIRYWTILGTLKLAHLHLPNGKSGNYMAMFITRQLISVTLGLLQGRYSTKNINAIWLAYLHYMHWRVIKYKDNGYNPF